MSTLSVRIGYRPIRLGFCVHRGNMEDVRRALRLTHTLWGGRYNPILPIGTSDEDNKLARELVDIFRLDALFPVADVPAIQEFIKSYSYLPWPKFERQLFIDGMRGKTASFLDVYHPVVRIFEEHIKDKTEPRVVGTFYEWGEDDSLKDVFLTMFGGYPTREAIGKDYAEFFVRNLRATRVPLGITDPVPADAFKMTDPRRLFRHLQFRVRKLSQAHIIPHNLPSPTYAVGFGKTIRR